MKHSHSHDDVHDHGHDPRSHRHQHEMKAGDGKGKILYLDAASGVSGDMFVSALLDLGVPFEVLKKTIDALPIEGVHLEWGTRFRQGIAGSSFVVHVQGEQPARHWQEIDDMLVHASLPAPVVSSARGIFRRLAEAEAQVHGISPQRVHFHEVGAVDAIVDIVGAASLVSFLEPSRIMVSPLPMGYGTVKAAHGILPLPAPATLLCLQGAPTYGVDVEGELVTPTGAAIVATFADEYSRWPSMLAERTGMGTGTKEWSSLPNVLRVVLGAPVVEKQSQVSPTHTVIETNVDDMTGELAAHTIRILMDSGARDVWVTPTTTKKGRPGMVLSVLAAKEDVARLEEAILRETTTLGVRKIDVTRTELPRKESEVETRFGAIAVKLAEQGDSVRMKPEFDACVRAAQQHGV
ncbi:MAG TPA: nickel pincer cofactor biosynthesis protein LarC, partial [Polyangiaceae bacterium]|nr:nickel pincer cofactor biosynthesis protein LarC [Polyangiaceae bacterium]